MQSPLVSFPELAGWSLMLDLVGIWFIRPPVSRICNCKITMVNPLGSPQCSNTTTGWHVQFVKHQTRSDLQGSDIVGLILHCHFHIKNLSEICQFHISLHLHIASMMELFLNKTIAWVPTINFVLKHLGNTYFSVNDFPKRSGKKSFSNKTLTLII